MSIGELGKGIYTNMKANADADQARVNLPSLCSLKFPTCDQPFVTAGNLNTGGLLPLPVPGSPAVHVDTGGCCGRERAPPPGGDASGKIGLGEYAWNSTVDLFNMPWMPGGALNAAAHTVENDPRVSGEGLLYVAHEVYEAKTGRKMSYRSEFPLVNGSNTDGWP